MGAEEEPRLSGHVTVDGQIYGPGDKIPAKHVDLIGEHAWVDGKKPGTRGGSKSKDDGVGGPPPMGGPGSAADAWAAYAASLGVDVSETKNRDEVIELLKAAGHPVEKTAE